MKYFLLALLTINVALHGAENCTPLSISEEIDAVLKNCEIVDEFSVWKDSDIITDFIEQCKFTNNQKAFDALTEWRWANTTNCFWNKPLILRIENRQQQRPIQAFMQYGGRTTFSESIPPQSFIVVGYNPIHGSKFITFEWETSSRTKKFTYSIIRENVIHQKDMAFIINESPSNRPTMIDTPTSLSVTPPSELDVKVITPLSGYFLK